MTDKELKIAAASAVTGAVVGALITKMYYERAAWLPYIPPLPRNVM